MQVSWCRWLLSAAVLFPGSAAIAQTTSKPAPRPTTWKTYCQPDQGFCFKYPGTWTMLGEILGGNGVTVAPPQKQERALWDDVTVALIIPPPEGDEEPVSIDQAIDKAIASARESGQNFETLQRQQRTVDDKPAQLVKVHYFEKSSGHEWVEELVFIAGLDGEVYSVGLKAAPASLPRVEPLFSRIVASWKLPEAEPEEEAPAKPSGAPASKPKSTAPVPTAPPKA
jgi:hypothetical protein